MCLPQSPYTLSWHPGFTCLGQLGSGHCSPPSFKPSLVLFSPSSRGSQTLALAKTLSTTTTTTVCQALGMRVDSAGTKLTIFGMIVKVTEA